jgi:cytochrome c oxidase cbb3-type subunit 2
MKGLFPLFLGIFGTFAFSWVGLTVAPNLQIGALQPQSDEEGADVYPAPPSGMTERGARVYAANGCVYCHSQQVRADYAASDIDRKWGTRRSAPRDYLFDSRAFVGKMRTGPDLANVGKREALQEKTAAPAPSPSGIAPPAAEPSEFGADGRPIAYTAAWHHQHLYAPRSLSPDSNMPAFQFLYEKRRLNGETAADALKFDGDSKERVDEGWEIVPTYDAKCLVAYLMSRDQSHALPEVKSAAAPASAPAPGKEAKK